MQALLPAYENFCWHLASEATHTKHNGLSVRLTTLKSLWSEFYDREVWLRHRLLQIAEAQNRLQGRK